MRGAASWSVTPAPSQAYGRMGGSTRGRRTLKSFHPGVYTCAGDSSALIVLSSSGEKAAANGETRGACTADSEAARRVRHECGTGRESEDKQNHPHQFVERRTREQVLVLNGGWRQSALARKSGGEMKHDGSVINTHPER